MRAATIRKYGGAECVRVEEMPDPRAAEDEVVIDVRAAALNHLDIWVIKGRPGASIKMPHVIGSDASGVVAEAGRRVEGIRPGDEVVLNPALFCGVCEFCLLGEESECASFGIVGLSRPGTFAQKVAAPARNVHPKPAHLDFTEAAAVPLVYQTAWRMLMTRGRLRAGETALIHGIGGGVAVAALQLAKLAGAETIVTSSSDDKLARAKALRADHVVNYISVKDVAHAVREITGGRGVDLCVNSVGAAGWGIDFGAVRRGGRIVICGVTTGAEAQTNLQTLYWNQIEVLGSTLGACEDFRQMMKAVAANRLKPVIDSVMPLEKAGEAIARMEKGGQFGKIVLKIA
jgi:NADPH:quinone reductase-like Zn-dependent oxidoreductase